MVSGMFGMNIEIPLFEAKASKEVVVSGDSEGHVAYGSESFLASTHRFTTWSIQFFTGG